MKKTILTALLALVALTAAAQDRLIRVDSESKNLRKASSQREMSGFMWKDDRRWTQVRLPTPLVISPSGYLACGCLNRMLRL